MLGVAVKAVEFQVKLMLDCGLIERTPERLFSVVANVKPQDFQESKPRDERTRDQLIADLVGKLTRATQL